MYFLQLNIMILSKPENENFIIEDYKFYYTKWIALSINCSFVFNINPDR